MKSHFRYGLGSNAFTACSYDLAYERSMVLKVNVIFQEIQDLLLHC